MKHLKVLHLALFVSLLCGSCSLRSRDTLAPVEQQVPAVEVEEPLADASLLPPAMMSQDQGYLIQPGDQMAVYFPSAADYGFTALVRPDGRITLPLYGDLLAEGQTPESLADAIERRYASTLRDSRAVVGLTATGPQPVYVYGEVGSPNRYTYTRGLDLMSAITTAGGALRTASLSNVVVIRVSPEGAYTYSTHDLNDLLDSSFPQPVWLQPRDIIVVPTSTIADIGLWIDQYIRVFLPPIDSFLRGRYFWYLANDIINNED